jgi:hypothetical protein
MPSCRKKDQGIEIRDLFGVDRIRRVKEFHLNARRVLERETSKSG